METLKDNVYDIELEKLKRLPSLDTFMKLAMESTNTFLRQMISIGQLDSASAGQLDGYAFELNYKITKLEQP